MFLSYFETIIFIFEFYDKTTYNLFMAYLIITFILVCAVAYYRDYKKYKKDSLRIKSYIQQFVINKELSSDEKLVVSFLCSLIEKKTIINLTRRRRETGIHFVKAGTNIFQSGYLAYLDDDTIYIDEKWLSEEHLLVKNKQFVKNLINFTYEQCKNFQANKEKQERMIKEEKMTHEFLKETFKANENKKNLLLKEL